MTYILHIWNHLSSFKKDLIDLLGLNIAIWGITLATFNQVLTAILTMLSISFLIYKWYKETKK